MKECFGDTSYFIALLVRSDRLHDKAIELSRKLTPFIVTAEYILIEVLDGFSGRGPTERLKVLRFVDELRVRPDVAVHMRDYGSTLFERGLSLWRERADKDWTLTDCTSFVLMQEFNVQDALTYDKHFVQAGFGALLRGSD